MQLLLRRRILMGTPTSKFALWAKFQPAMGCSCSGNLVLGRKQPRFLVDEVHCLKIVWEARTAAKARPYPRYRHQSFSLLPGLARRKVDRNEGPCCSP